MAFTYKQQVRTPDPTNLFHLDWGYSELGTSVVIDARENVIVGAGDLCSQPALPTYSEVVETPPGSPGTSSFGLNSRAIHRELGYDAEFLIVGDDANDVAGANSGSAFLYKWNSSTLVWDYKFTFQPSSPAAGRKFGYAVAVSQYYGYAFVSSIYDGTHGTITCFKRSSDTVWSQVYEIDIAETGACTSNIALFSAYGGKSFLVGTVDGENGKVRQYNWVTGDTWSLYATTTAPVGAVAFGQNIINTYVDNWVLFISDHLANGGKGCVHEVYGTTIDATFAPDELVAGDHFGEHMADGGGDLFIGAPGTNSGEGAIYIYTTYTPQMKYDYAYPWVFKKTIYPPNPEAGAHFGQSVGATWGNWFAVAEPNATVGSNANAGKVHLYSLKGNNWDVTHWRTIEGTNANQKLGSALFMATGAEGKAFFGADSPYTCSPDMLITGDTEDSIHIASRTAFLDPVMCGVAFVLDQDGNLVQKIEPQEGDKVAQAAFGSSYYGGRMSTYGDWLAIPAPGLTYSSTGLPWFTGYVSLYKWDSSTKQYHFKQRFNGSASPLKGAFGHSTHLSSDRLVVGAPLATVGGIANRGEAYVFSVTGDIWSEYHRFDSPVVSDVKYGNSVALAPNGLQLFISASAYHGGGLNHTGGAWAYVDSGSGYGASSELSPGAKLKAIMGFGWAFWAETDLVYVGAPFWGNTYDEEGCVFVFRRSGGTWSESVSEFINCPRPDSYTGNAFGYSFAATATSMLIGAPYYYNYAGELYFFTRGTPLVLQQRYAKPPAFDTGPNLGSNVALLDDFAASGIPERWANNDGLYGGVIYLYIEIPPWVDNEDPYDGETGVPVTTNISCQVHEGNSELQEPFGWGSIGQAGDLHDVYALISFGGSLYAGGSNADASVFRWNGSIWSDVSGALGTASTATKLLVFDGYLYVATDGSGVYRYDSDMNWTSIGTPGSGEIWALTEFNAHLIAGCNDGHAYQYESGTTWTDLGDSGSGAINALGVLDNELYAAGADGDAYLYEGGTSWSNIGSVGVSEYNYSIIAWNGSIYIGTDIGEVFRYDGGTTWTATGLGSYADGCAISSLVEFDGKLYAGTSNYSKVYYYDGLYWTDLGGLGSNYWADSLAVHNGEIYAGSYSSGHVYSNLSSILIQLNGIDVWKKGAEQPGFSVTETPNIADPSILTQIGSSFPSWIWSSAVVDGVLYVSSYAHDQTIWRWDGGTSWTAITSPVHGSYKTLCAHDGKLYCVVSYVAGEDIYRWDDPSWVSVGCPTDGDTAGSVWSMVSFEGHLYAGTDNAVAGGPTPHGSRIYRLEDGGGWTNVGEPGWRGVEYPTIACLVVHVGSLFAFVSFTGAEPSGVYKYEGGTSWSPCGNAAETSGYNYSKFMASYKGNLYLGTDDESSNPGHVYKWLGGTAWQDVGSLGDGEIVYSLAVFNDILYGGTDGTVGTGVLFAFNGISGWTSVGNLTSAYGVYAIAVDDGLYAGTDAAVFELTGANISDGFIFEIDPDTDLVPSTVYTVRVVANNQTTGVDVDWHFTTELSTTKITDVLSIAKDVIMIVFSTTIVADIKTEHELNYEFANLSGNAIPVFKKVLSAYGRTVTLLFLQLKQLEWGQRYQITVKKVYESSGKLVLNMTAEWLHHRTKVDAAIESLASMWDTKNRSTIRSVLEAIMISDEKIGGDY